MKKEKPFLLPLPLHMKENHLVASNLAASLGFAGKKTLDMEWMSELQN